MPLAIKVENLSKQYRLGQIGTGTLSHDLNRFWASIRGKEDPYSQIGSANDRTQKADSDYVWALKDINFEIEQGDAVGIIGRNGAGKSTLLKILSRTTLPTTGSVKMKGRIASLLEVGTGFHPEMTGRENIYQNGAILGMTRHEITRKFDEIVDFSGCEAYIDTPVKRYSSGMYVRLAFAVAAHLESEILIVDEVLAVGDAEFQKKCLGKMNDVAKGEGRTVLFVSHNMAAVKSLCNKGIVMSNGSSVFYGEIIKSIDYYSGLKTEFLTSRDFEKEETLKYSTDFVDFLAYKLCDSAGKIIDTFCIYDEVNVDISYRIKDNKFGVYPNLHFFDRDDNYLFVACATDQIVKKKSGLYSAQFVLPPYMLNVGIVKIGIAFTIYPGTDVQFFINPAITTEVYENDLSLRSFPFTGTIPGYTRLNLSCNIKEIVE
jgi:lipopolysaccharide transport system ATP-binding protein